VSDEAFSRKLNALFWPEYEYEVFAKHLAENKQWAISHLNELYEKRGDAYLMSGDFKSGVSDFNRIYSAIPIFGNLLDRWRQLGANVTGTYFMDVKTVRFPNDGYGRVWFKTVTKTTSTVQAFEIDCRGGRLKSTSVVEYGADGKVLRSSDVPTGWQPTVPDSVGERLLRGLCN